MTIVHIVGLRKGIRWVSGGVMMLSVGTVILLGCDRTVEPESAVAHLAPEVMLRFVPQPVPAFDPGSISGTAGSIAVTDGGILAMLEPDGPDDPVLLLMDVATGSVNRVIRRGMGPGELSGAGRVFADRSRIEVLDLAKMALVSVNADGEVVSERRVATADAMVLSVGSDSLDVIPLQHPGTRGVFRRSKKSRGERILIEPDEPFFASLREVPDRRAIPAYAARGDVLLLGDGERYRVALYTSFGDTIVTFGRELPPRLPTERERARHALTLRGAIGPGMSSSSINRELENYMSTPLPHFEHPAAWIDGTGRVRIVGSVSDSTFVDVFANGVHLGRVMLECANARRRIAQSDDWLVLLCEPDADAGATIGVDLQVYSVKSMDVADTR